MNNKYLRLFAAAAALISVFVLSLSVLRAVYPRKYSEYVSEYASLYGISENLVYAIIKCESGFNPYSCSGAGAVGLMQITPDTLSWAAMKEGTEKCSRLHCMTSAQI